MKPLFCRSDARAGHRISKHFLVFVPVVAASWFFLSGGPLLAGPPATAPAAPALAPAVKVRVLKELEDSIKPEFAKKTPAEQKVVIDDIVANVAGVLPSLLAGQSVSDYANPVIRYGYNPLVDRIDAWGEDAPTQAALRPVAEAVDAMLARAEKLSRDRGEYLLKNINAIDDPKVKTWEQVDALHNRVIYYRALAGYGLARSLPPSDPRRAQVCQQAIEALKEFDNKDSGAQPAVRVATGKLYLAMGRYDLARVVFKKAFDLPTSAIIDEFEARYQSVIVDLQEKGGKAAAAAYESFLKWMGTRLRLDPAAVKSPQIRATILGYRVKLAEAEQEPDPAKKAKLRADAEASLKDLVAKRPDVKDLIDARPGAK